MKTANEIIEDLKKMAQEYLAYSNNMRDENLPYREKVFYSGLAIQTLQEIQELAGRYPQLVRTLPFGTIPDYSNQSIYNLFDRQKRLYLEELKKLRSKIKDGSYNISDEINLKVERLHDVNSIINDNRTLNVAPGAFDEKKRALLSIAGSALKYPFHVVNRVLEAGAHIIGHVATLPLHLVSYPINLLFKPGSPYTGKVVEELGDKLSNFLSTGVRAIDRGIKKI